MIEPKSSADHDPQIMIGAGGVGGYGMSRPGSDVAEVEAGVSVGVAVG